MSKKKRYHKKRTSYKHFWLFLIIIYTLLIFILNKLYSAIDINYFYTLLLSGLFISISLKLILNIINNKRNKERYYLNKRFLLWIFINSLIYWFVTSYIPELIKIELLSFFIMGIIFYLFNKIFRYIWKKNSIGAMWFFVILLILLISVLNLWSQPLVIKDHYTNTENILSNTPNDNLSNDIPPNDNTNEIKDENAPFNPNSIIVKKCTDGTKYNNCSKTKPYYCQDGNLIKYPEKCLCEPDEIYDNNKCLNKYQTGAKEVNLEYVLRGKKRNINTTVYKGMNDYLAGLDRSVTYYGTPPTNEEMEMIFVNQEDQIELIKPLVDKIKSITSNEDDQARIAISIVQNLPYDWDSFTTYSIDNRYAYETLYDMTGVCGEKTRLLAVLLKELGYGVVLLNYSKENHQAIGIKCPKSYANVEGYCFVEATTPSIITNDQGDYIGAGKLISSPKIYIVSEGKSFDSVKEEYNDAILYNKLIKKGDVLSLSDYEKWENIVDKYGFKFS